MIARYHFGSTANSKVCWRKIIRIREKIIYTTKLFGIKSFRIQISLKKQVCKGRGMHFALFLTRVVHMGWLPFVRI